MPRLLVILFIGFCAGAAQLSAQFLVPFGVQDTSEHRAKTFIYGYMDTLKNVIIAPSYRTETFFDDNGLAVVTSFFNNNKMTLEPRGVGSSLINKKGEVIFAVNNGGPLAIEPLPWSSDLYWAHGDTSYVITKTGKIIGNFSQSKNVDFLHYPCKAVITKYDTVDKIYPMRRIISEWVSDVFLDSTGKALFPPLFRFFRQREEYKADSTIIKMNIFEIGYFSNGLCPVIYKTTSPGGRSTGYIDVHGNIKIAPVFSSASGFNDGRALVSTFDSVLGANRFFIIDTNGKPVSKTVKWQLVEKQYAGLDRILSADYSGRYYFYFDDRIVGLSGRVVNLWSGYGHFLHNRFIYMNGDECAPKTEVWSMADSIGHFIATLIDNLPFNGYDNLFSVLGGHHQFGWSAKVIKARLPGDDNSPITLCRDAKMGMDAPIEYQQSGCVISPVPRYDYNLNYYAYFDPVTGKQLCPFEKYEDVTEFHNGFAMVKVNGLYICVDTNLREYTWP